VRKVLGSSNDKTIHERTALQILDRYFSELDKHGARGNTTLNEKIMENALGFSITRSPSNVSGTGVFVSCGRVKKGSLVSIYPGTIDIILQSILAQTTRLLTTNNTIFC
jgi:hypothetical protein